MNRELRTLSAASGAACTAIGVAHLVAGSGSVPGAAANNATEDSQESFFGAVFAAYGLTWLWAAKRRDLALVDALAVTMGVGGVGRLLSARRAGRPHPFFTAMTALELAAPAVFVPLTAAERRRRRRAG